MKQITTQDRIAEAVRPLLRDCQPHEIEDVAGSIRETVFDLRSDLSDVRFATLLVTLGYGLAAARNIDLDLVIRQELAKRGGTIIEGDLA